MNKDLLTYRLGYFMPIGGRIFGVCSILFGLALFSKFDESFIFPLVGTFLIIVGPACFATKNLVIDNQLKQLVEITSFLGISSKTVLDLNKYSYVSIISQLYKETSRTVIHQDSVMTYKLYDVILLSKNHLGKYKVISTPDLADATIQSKKLSDYLQMDIVKFAPAVRKRK